MGMDEVILALNIPDLQYIQRLKEKWDSFVSNSMIGYDSNLLETRVLDPKDGRLPFFLVFNDGRRKYIEKLAQRKDDVSCPFCSDDFEDLRIDDLSTLRVLPNKFPCLPHQFILTPNEHTGSLEVQYIDDAISFARRTRFKVYCNASGSGGAYTHLVFQASGKHHTAPEQDFFGYVQTKQLAEGTDTKAEMIEHTVFGVRLTGENTSPIVSRLAESYEKPINLIFKDSQVYIFPRTEVEVPSGFGMWKFGVLEAIGMFICQDAQVFRSLGYSQLEKAMREISQSDISEQDRFIDTICQLVE